MRSPPPSTSGPNRIGPCARPNRRRWLLGALFAITLCFGLFQTAALFADDEPTPILSMRGNHLVATGVLRVALSEKAAPAGRSRPVVGPRQRNGDGTECRRFAGRPDVDGAVAGTACMIEGDWRVTEVRQDLEPPKLR